MAVITGGYDFYEDGASSQLSIQAVDSSGALTGNLGGRKIHGAYQDSNGTITFTAQDPGKITPTSPPKLVLDYYTGQVFVDSQSGRAVGMSGIHHHTWFHAPPLAQTTPQNSWLAIFAQNLS
jgi:hypothetical protein